MLRTNRQHGNLARFTKTCESASGTKWENIPACHKSFLSRSNASCLPTVQEVLASGAADLIGMRQDKHHHTHFMTKHLLLAFLATIISSCSKAADLPSGIYLKTVFSGGTLNNTIYVFKDGQVTTNPSGDLEKIDFAEIKAKQSGNVGTYTRTGDALTIQWSDGTNHSGTIKPDKTDGFDYRSDPYAAVKPLPAGMKLKGTYIGGASVAGAYASVKYTFDGMGGYTTDAAGVVVTTTSASAVTAGSSTSDTGTYNINGTRIQFKGSAGTREISLYNIPTSDVEPEMLLLGGVVLTKQ